MSEEKTQLQKRKSSSLMDELNTKLAKETKGQIPGSLHTKKQAQTNKVHILSQKIAGLQQLVHQVKAKGTVVAADMLTPEMLTHYNTNYGLSKKDLERMLGDLQRDGQPMDAISPQKTEASVNHSFAMPTRSKLLKKGQDSIGTNNLLKALGKQLNDKRWSQTQELPSFQLVTLTDEEALEYQKTYGLSKKELNKLSLDIQTGAVKVDDYRHMPGTEAAQPDNKEAEQKQRATENQKSPEIAAKLEARKKYLKEGPAGGDPSEWILGKHADKVEAILKDPVMGGDPLEQELIVKSVADIEKRFKENLEKIEKGLEEALKPYKTKLSLPGRIQKELLTQIRDSIETKHAETLLKPNAEHRFPLPSPNDLFNKEVAERQRFYLRERNPYELLSIAIVDREYKDRINQCIERAGRLAEASGGISITGLDCPQIDKFFDPNLSDQEFEERVAQLSRRIQDNQGYVQSILEEQISFSDNRKKIHDLLLERIGEELAFGSQEDVANVIKDMIGRQMPKEVQASEENIRTAMINFRSTLLPDAKKKKTLNRHTSLANIPDSTWRKLAPKVLKTGDPPQVMEEKLKGLIKRVQLNLATFFLAYHRSKDSQELMAKLPETVWSGLYRFRDQNIAEENFGSKMREQFETLLEPYKDGNIVAFGSTERFSMDEYLERKTGGKGSEEPIPPAAEFANQSLDILSTGKQAKFHLLLNEDPVSDTKTVSKQGAFEERHRSHFNRAHAAWKIFKEKGWEREALDGCSAYLKAPYGSEAQKTKNTNPAQEIKELLRKVGTDEANELAKNLRRGVSKNFMNEFLLCEMDDLLWHQEINPSLHQSAANLAKKDDADFLLKLGAYIVAGMRQLMDVLNSNHIGSKERDDYLRKLRPVLIGMYENKARENVDRFGVESWEKAMQQLNIHLQD
ncbi:MAG: hypothetical protein IJC59_06385 [Lachnospiraceae bacterium]|nr:hypothetical protein [Lachnospiraceae bacterium]